MGDAVETAVASQLGTAVPGLALVAVTADGVVDARAWGRSDLSSGAAMAIDTACNWFSMTKLVTATVAVQLAERGVLDLDAPVRTYYEPFEVVRPVALGRNVTTRHLLSHSSGLANPIPLRWVHLAAQQPPDRQAWVRRLVEKHLRLRSEPGTIARYSNLGYLVLGEVIEGASGRPFEACVAELLAAIRAEHTGFAMDADLTWATPYQRRHTPANTMLGLLVPRTILGANHGRFRALNHFYVDGAAYGGLVGPVREAARFLQLHVCDGELDGVRVISGRSARMMRTITARGKKRDAGLGWLRPAGNAGEDHVEHPGGGAGFWNCMRLYAERGVGAVVMGNATAYDHGRVLAAACAQLAPR